MIVNEISLVIQNIISLVIFFLEIEIILCLSSSIYHIWIIRENKSIYQFLNLQYTYDVPIQDFQEEK